MKKKLLLLTSVLFLGACSNPSDLVSLSNERTGSTSITFKFPSIKSSFGIKAIPLSTDSIEIDILGKGIDAPIKRTAKRSDADKDGNVKLTIKDLPAGEKNVKVSAFDANKKLVASGTDKTVIEADKVAKLTILLKEEAIKEEPKPPVVTEKPVEKPIEEKPIEKPVIPEVINKGKLSIKLTGFSAGTFSIYSRLNTAGGTSLVKSSSTDTLDFEDVASGTTKLNAVITSNGLPIAKITKEFEIDKDKRVVDLAVDKITPITEFDTDLAVAETKIPESIKSLFAGHLIGASDVAPLSFGKANVDIAVDGGAVASGTDFKITENSSLKITAKNPDQRQLKYIWAITKSTSTTNKLNTKIIDERGSVLQVKLDPTIKYISFIATDEKTYSNVIVMPLEQFTKASP
ncbi:MAG: hypothetical protein AABZ74_08295 [Cyanobacteriota bacterium]